MEATGPGVVLEITGATSTFNNSGTLLATARRHPRPRQHHRHQHRHRSDRRHAIDPGSGERHHQRRHPDQSRHAEVDWHQMPSSNVTTITKIRPRWRSTGGELEITGATSRQQFRQRCRRLLGGTLDLDSITVTNTGTVQIDVTPSILDLESATISGGILTNPAPCRRRGTSSSAAPPPPPMTARWRHRRRAGDHRRLVQQRRQRCRRLPAPRSTSRASPSPTPARSGRPTPRSWIWRAPPSAAAS